MDVPDHTPRSPLRIVGPVLVTALPPRTAKLPAVPRGTVVCAPAGDCERSRVDTIPMGTRAASQEYLRALRETRLPIACIYRTFR